MDYYTCGLVQNFLFSKAYVHNGYLKYFKIESIVSRLCECELEPVILTVK